tara:strand:+ start:130 stop:855 length:726 start_codon:yes stop_codon:yes gene_type:complete
MVNNITAIIPARGGSKGVFRKNIKLLGDHPLIAYSIVACKLSKNIDRIIVSTEDKEIANIAKQYGAEIPFMRPEKYSKDDSTDGGFLNHFFENINVDEVALIRPTTPLRNLKFMDKGIDLFFEKRDEISGLRSVQKAEESPYKLFQLKNGLCRGFFEHYHGVEKYFNLPRQTFPQTYKANGHIDIVKKETLRYGDVFGTKTYAYIGNPISDIDSVEDFEYAEYQIKTKEINLINKLGETNE